MKHLFTLSERSKDKLVGMVKLFMPFMKATRRQSDTTIFAESLKSLMSIFAESAESAESAKPIFANRGVKDVRVSLDQYSTNIQRISNLYITPNRYFTRFAAVFALVFVLGVGNVWGADVITQSSFSNISSSGYNNYTCTGTSGASYLINFYKNGNTYMNFKKTTVSSGLVVTSAPSGKKIKSVTATFSNQLNIYWSNKNYSSNAIAQNNDESDAVSMTSGTACIPTSKATSFRLYSPSTAATVSQITIEWEDDTPSCTNPTTLLSISSSNTATVGTNKTLTTSGGNNGTVTWTVANGTGSATVSGNILTPTSAGTVTVTATQDDNVGKCGKVVNQTITISKAAATITLSDANGTSSVSGTHYGGDSYTLPTTAATCTGKTLVGWSTVEIPEEGAKPSSNYYDKGTSVTLAAGSNKYYAVYATKLTDGSSSPAQLSFTYGSHEGWTLHSECDKSSYYLLQNNSYIESPTINDLSSITSIVIGVGSFASKGAGSVSDGSTTYASFSIPASKSNNSVTLQPQTNPLSGSGKIRITNTDGSSYTTNSNQQKGTRFYSMTINYTTETPPTYKSDYATTCCTPLAQVEGSANLSQWNAGVHIY